MKKYKIYCKGYITEKIQAIKIIRYILPELSLREAKKIVESIMGGGDFCINGDFSDELVDDLKSLGFGVIIYNDEFLPEHLFSIDGSINKNKEIIYENGNLKIISSDLNISIKLDKDDEEKIIKLLGGVK